VKFPVAGGWWQAWSGRRVAEGRGRRWIAVKVRQILATGGQMGAPITRLALLDRPTVIERGAGALRYRRLNQNTFRHDGIAKPALTRERHIPTFCARRPCALPRLRGRSLLRLYLRPSFRSGDTAVLARHSGSAKTRMKVRGFWLRRLRTVVEPPDKEPAGNVSPPIQRFDALSIQRF
jgi:hypothetical protein